MLHSEIIEHRRWSRVAEGNRDNRKRTEASNAKAKENEEAEESEDGSETDENGKVTTPFGVLNAKANKNYKRDSRRQKGNKIRLVKKTGKAKMGRCSVDLGSHA